MTAKQLTRLQERINTLKKANRIVWIEGISAGIIKGKFQGKECHFVKADSLNVDGGCWYYILRWEGSFWSCSCEATKPCKHETTLNIVLVTRYRVQREKEKAEAYEKRVAFLASQKRQNAPLNGNREFSLLKAS